MNRMQVDHNCPEGTQYGGWKHRMDTSERGDVANALKIAKIAKLHNMEIGKIELIPHA